MPSLFTNLKIRNITLKNRVAMSPMCQYSATDGFANDWHMVHLGTRAAGGAGLVIAEATAVSPEGRISPGDLGLWKDDHIDKLEQIVRFIHSQNCAAGIQLAHAGRKASCAVPAEGGKQLDESKGGWITVAPSDLPFHEGERAPEQLDLKGIHKIISDFSQATARALSAGFDIIEIHSAHGYLLHEFLSPLSNKRSDEYGGSFENRTRLLRSITSAVRAAWPEGKPLFVRISSTDWKEGGWDIDDSVTLSGSLKSYGVDLIDCSSGGNVADAKIPVAPGYQVPFSASIRKTGIMTGAVGMITHASQADAIIQEGQADLVIMGRELLRNPYFPIAAARELGAEPSWPLQYLRAR